MLADTKKTNTEKEPHLFFQQIRRPLHSWFPWFITLTIFCIFGFLISPILIAWTRNINMGLEQKIFYFHVPCAWVMFLATFISGIASAVFLFKNSENAELLAKSAAALVVLFGACVLVTGPLWARKQWGHYWKWDVRLTTSLLLWIIFFMYFISIRYAGFAGKKLAAALALFGLIDVPMIYISASRFRTQHPKPTVVSTLDKSVQPAFWISMISITLLFSLLLWLYFRISQMEAKQQEFFEILEEQDLLNTNME